MGLATDPRGPSGQLTIVLGSGRSGTSACAELLSLCGVRMERTLHQAGNLNPRGFFEDRRLVELNRALLDAISAHPWLPPRDDVKMEDIRELTAPISDHIAERLKQSSPWGFKDPRTSWLVPIYARIFNHLRVTPKYVLCVRDPSSAVRSLMDTTAMSRSTAELYWFARNLSVLRDTGAGCFVCHYEKMIEDPVAVAGALSDFVFGPSIAQAPTAEDARTVVTPSLDRASVKPVAMTGERTRRLYALLQSMDGVSFDREHVASEVVALQEAHDFYQPWLNVAAARAQHLVRQAENESPRRHLETTLEAVATAMDAGPADAASIDAALRAAGAGGRETLPEAASRLIGHAEALHDDAVTLRSRLRELSESESETQRRLVFERAKAEAAARALAARPPKRVDEAETRRRQQQADTIKALRVRIRKLEESKRFRMGSAIADALLQPGLRTLTMPAKVIRIALSRDKPAPDEAGT